MDRSKRNARKSKNAPPPPQADEHHSLDNPSCNLVADVSSDVFHDAADKINAGSTTLNEAAKRPQSMLGSLIREHLLEIRRKQAAATPKRKPRKKRKKKKGKAAEAEKGQTETVATISSPKSQDSDNSQLAERPQTAEASQPVEQSTPVQQQPHTDPASKTSPVVLQWLDQQEPKSLALNRSLSAFCEALSKQERSPPLIAMTDIAKALDAVTCIPCRASAEGYWQSTGIPMAELDLDTVGGFHQERVILEPSMIEIPSSHGFSIPIANDEWGDVERAFDYQAMEEGMVPSSGGASKEEKEPDAIVVLEPVMDAGGKIHSVKVTSELDVVTVERLLRQVLLPCGLEELQHPNAFPVTDEQFQSITTHVSNQERRIHMQLTELGDKKNSVGSLFNATEAKPAQPGVYDVKSSTALINCDKECDELLTSLLSMLLQVTTLTDGLPNAEWAHGRIKRLWDSYETGAQRIVEQSLQHEGKLLQLANRPGVIPQMFLNVAHRSSFRDLVSKKVDVLGEYFLEFFTTLTDDEENPQGPIFLRRLMSYPPFTKAAIGEPLNRTNLDNVIASLVEAFSKLMHSVKSGSITEIHEAQEAKINKVFELLTESTSTILAEYQEIRLSLEQIDQSKWKALRKEGTELIEEYASQHAEESKPDSSPDSFVGEVDDLHSMELAKMRRDLVLLVINMISQWRCLRWMRSQTVEAPIMPLRLLNWMNENEHGDSTSPQPCHGRGGKRRLAGVLASMLYQWLVDRCNEWHAELTQSELLEAMAELEEPSSEAPSKASKKKKKKKPATSNKSEPVVSNDPGVTDLAEKASTDSDLKSNDVVTSTPANGLTNGARPLPPMNGDIYEPGVEEAKEEYTSSVDETKEEQYFLTKEQPAKAKPDFKSNVERAAPNKTAEMDKRAAAGKKSFSAENKISQTRTQAKSASQKTPVVPPSKEGKGDGAKPAEENSSANEGKEQKPRHEVFSNGNSRADQDQSADEKKARKHSKKHGKNREGDADNQQEIPILEAKLIGVKDAAGKVQPAQEFLVARLFEILQNGSKDARGKPIVFL